VITLYKVTCLKFHRNLFRGFEAREIKICRFPLHWLLALEQLSLPYRP